MPALVESMFSVRTLPWHGLGEVIQEAPTSEEAIKIAKLDWDVTPEPIYKENGVPISGFFANVRSSDNSVLGIVSKKYSIVQNRDAFSFTDSLLEEGQMTYETAGSLRNGKTVWMLGKMPTDKILDDDLEPYVCFTNTHDGTGSIRVCMTPVRVVCNNTLNFALSTAKRSWSAVHRGNMESKLAEAQHTLGLIDDYTYHLKLEAERLAGIKISDDTVLAMIDSIYPVSDLDSEIKKRRAGILKENFFDCLKADDIQNYRGTAYGVMMAATDFADHSAPLRATATFRENRWGEIISGHPFVDKMYKMIAA